LKQNDFKPYETRPSTSPNGRKRSKSRIVKRIVKLKNKDGNPTYEVTTVVYDKDGNKAFEKAEQFKEKPKVFKDINNSLKMLEHIKKDPNK
jgi:fatty acid-binding protein DegV